MSAVNRPDPGTSLLLVDDERPLREAIADYFRELGYRVETAGDLGSARERLRDARFDVVLCDVFLPDGDGTDLVAETAREAPDTAVILLTGYGSIESAVAAVRAGAFDYLTKPIVDEELAIAVSRAVERHRIVVENRQLKKQLDEKYGLGTIVGRDYKMQRMFDLLESVADTRTSVLILGESGTGKTMTARALHHLSDRRDAPFVEVACGALPEGLLESELFGHVKGAFTGATTDRPGKFLQADGGTLFLDEIATAPQSLQVKLLRVIQDREFEAVGGTKTHKVDVRLVFATNADLAEMVKAGEFREDLYYRINVIELTQPPLRERVGDVPLLAEHYLRRFAEQAGRPVRALTPAAVQALQAYDWPGNVRELLNVIERAVVLCRGETIDVADLPEGLRPQALPGPLAADTHANSLKAAMAAPERQLLIDALTANEWNRQETAKMLGINRTTLYKKMKRLDISYESVAAPV